MKPKTKDRLLFGLGVAICFAVAALSVLVEKLIPGELLGASIIALFMGTFINSFFHPAWMKFWMGTESNDTSKIPYIHLCVCLGKIICLN